MAGAEGALPEIEEAWRSWTPDSEVTEDAPEAAVEVVPEIESVPEVESVPEIEAVAEVEAAEEGDWGASSEGAAANPFARRDPHDRARRLARVLASDIVSYYGQRYTRALAAGTLKEEFQEEVQKSWSEYVDQVGLEMAESTTYFHEALNQVLAKGEQVF